MIDNVFIKSKTWIDIQFDINAGFGDGGYYAGVPFHDFPEHSRI